MKERFVTNLDPKVKKKLKFMALEKGVAVNQLIEDFANGMDYSITKEKAEQVVNCMIDGGFAMYAVGHFDITREQMIEVIIQAFNGMDLCDYHHQIDPIE